MDAAIVYHRLRYCQAQLNSGNRKSAWQIALRGLHLLRELKNIHIMSNGELKYLECVCWGSIPFVNQTFAGTELVSHNETARAIRAMALMTHLFSSYRPGAGCACFTTDTSLLLPRRFVNRNSSCSWHERTGPAHALTGRTRVFHEGQTAASACWCCHTTMRKAGGMRVLHLSMGSNTIKWQIVV